MLLSPVRAAGEDRDTLRLAGVVYLGDLPTLVAEELGFFQQDELALAVEYGFSGQENLERLLAGELEFALMALTPFVLHHLNRPPDTTDPDPVILANVSHSLGLINVVARPDSGIEAPSDLVGKRVGVMPGTNADFILSLFVDHHGLSRSQLDIRHASTVELGEALETAELDAAILWEPWASMTEKAMGERLIRFPVSQVYTGRWVLVARRDVVESQPQAVASVLTAYMRAADHIDRYPENVARLYARHSRLTVDEVHSQFDHLIYGLNLDWSLVTGLKQQAEWARENGRAPEGREASVLSHLVVGPLRSVKPTAMLLPVKEGHEAALQ